MRTNEERIRRNDAISTIAEHSSMPLNPDSIVEIPTDELVEQAERFNEQERERVWDID